MEKLATDIYTFANLIQDGFTYVDKTDRLWPLVNKSIGRQFFIARPRRSGKSAAITFKNLIVDLAEKVEEVA